MTESKIDCVIPLLQMNPVFGWHPCNSVRGLHSERLIVFPFPLSSSGFDIRHRRTDDDDDGQKDQITSKHHMDATWVGLGLGGRSTRNRETEVGDRSPLFI